MLTCPLCGQRWPMLYWLEGQLCCIECCPPERREAILGFGEDDKWPPGMDWAWPIGKEY